MIDFLIAAALGAVRAEEPPSLLVIAPQALRAPAEEYALQRRTDLPTEFMTLEQALTSSGTDDPERLKRTIFAKWQANPSLRHVLLVGDADILPVRYMVLDRVTPGAFDYAFYPSDLYYADLARRDGSFDDWNRAQGDGSAEQAFHALYFGEVRGEKNKNDAINFDAIDYRPEVAVGRWPASSVEEVQRIARKSLAWCGRRRPAEAALIAVSGWIENRPMMDHLAACLPRQWVRTRLYWKDAARDDGTPQPDAEAARELLMRGVPFIFHSGHGSDDAWDQSLHASMAPLLTNHYEPVMLFSAGCSTARLVTLPPYEAYVDAHGAEHKGTNGGEIFSSPPPPPAPYQHGANNPTGLGEAMLRATDGGAAAYFGCTTGSQPCAMTLLEGFASALAREESPRLGDAWIRAIDHYWTKENLSSIEPTESWYPSSIFFQGMKFILYGDPSLPTVVLREQPAQPASHEASKTLRAPAAVR